MISGATSNRIRRKHYNLALLYKAHLPATFSNCC